MESHVCVIKKKKKLFECAKQKKILIGTYVVKETSILILPPEIQISRTAPCHNPKVMLKFLLTSGMFHSILIL